MFQETFTLSALAHEAHNAKLEDAAQHRLVWQNQLVVKNRLVAFVQHLFARFATAHRLKNANVVLQTSTQK